MKNKQSGFTLIELLLVILVFLGVGGWFANIYKLIETPLTLVEFGTVEVLRIAGIPIVPLGSFMGFM